MTSRIPINPTLLTLARERAGLDVLALASRLNLGTMVFRNGSHE